MNPALFVLIVLAAAALIFSAVLLAASLLGAWLTDRDEQRDAVRHARLAERQAAENGRPHTTAVIQRATRRP